MEPCCLVCRASDVDELISVSCVTSTSRKSIREMLEIFVNVRASQILLDNDNVVDQASHQQLPDQVCDQCLARLDRAYRVWKASRSVGSIRKCEEGAEQFYQACRICSKSNALVSMFYFCKHRKIQIAVMVEYLVNVKVKPADRLPPYICVGCLKDVKEGYGFKKDTLESIKFFRELSLHPWQKMQFRADCPERLVVEVSSKGVLGKVDGTSFVTCSVCSLRSRFEKLGRTCRGCRLEFRNYDDIVRQVEEQRQAEEVELMEVFEAIADYDEVVHDDIGDLLNNEMLVEVEQLPVKVEEEPVKQKDKKPKLDSSTTEQNNKGDSIKKVDKKSLSIHTIMEYKCCFEGCSHYGVVQDLGKHFLEAHSNISLESPPSPFKCTVCGTTFPDETSLKSHRGEPSSLYKCSGCPFASRSHDCAKRHIERAKDEKWRHGSTKPMDSKDVGTYYVVHKKLDENSFMLKRIHERCCWCGEMFMELHELEAHREAVHAVVKAPMQCEKCNRPFDSLLAFSIHRTRGSRRTHYYCQTCEKVFWEAATYKLHKFTEHATATEGANEADQHLYQSVIPCCGCEETFETTEQLEEHRQEMHLLQVVNDDDQSLGCKSCGKDFPTLRHFQAHVRKYKSGTLYRCLVVGCMFKTAVLGQIKNHVTSSNHVDAKGKTMTIRRMNPSIYFCCVARCSFESSSYDEIVAHAASSHEEKRQRNAILYWDSSSAYKCEACFKDCRTHVSFLNHKNGRAKRECNFCRKPQPRAELEAHEASCPKREEFVCEICSTKCVGHFRYKIHMNAEHAVVVPHAQQKPQYNTPKVVCTVCGVMVRKYYLPTHMHTKHQQTRAFQCKQCDARFNVFTMLQTHVKNVHSTVKLYPCRQGCEKRYKHAGDRVRHEQLVHLGITPFVCEVCSESFVRDRDLRLHARKHTGRKLFGCDHCGADYDRLIEFREHRKACGSAGRIAAEGQDE